MKALLFLLSFFLCTSGFIATEVTVIGIVSHSTSFQNNLGAGAGVFFCVLGTLLASISLRYCNRCTTRKLAVSTTMVTYASAVLFWLLYKFIPLLMLSYIVAVIYSAIYVILNYCLSVSVYHFDQHIERDKVAKQIAFPVCAAQAVMPIVSGWLLDVYGLGPAITIIAFAYSAPLALILFIPKNQPIQHHNITMDISTTQGVPGIVLYISAISSFALNWYFSSALTLFSKQNISTIMIGGVISSLNVAGIVGAGLIAASSIHQMNHQIKLLFISSFILFPGVLLTHSMYNLNISISTVVLLVLTGLLTGIDSALIISIKFKLFNEKNYGYYHSLLSLLTIGSSLIGSLVGTIFTSKLGWNASLMLCITICTIFSIKLALSIFTSLGKLNYEENL
jgi:MFS family permease